MSRTFPEFLVGIDLGTTMTKAAVLGLDGTELSRGKAPTPGGQFPPAPRSIQQTCLMQR